MPGKIADLGSEPPLSPHRRWKTPTAPSGNFVFFRKNSLNAFNKHPSSVCDRSQPLGTILKIFDVEIVGQCEACKRGKIYLNLFEEIGMYNPEVDRPIIFEDNAAAGILATSDVLNSKSRHMNLRFSICKEMIMENKTFQLWHLPTKFQLADINTKAVGAKTFVNRSCVARFGAIRPQVQGHSICRVPEAH